MKKLTIKELAPYLPFDLYFIRYERECVDKTATNIIWSEYKVPVRTQLNAVNLNGFEYDNSKPILRPLSDLTKEIEVNGEKFVPMIKLVSPDGKEWDLMKVVEYNPFPKLGGDRKYYKVEHDSLGEIISINPNNVLVLPYNLVQYLFEWHFDVFGLIEQGLAINLNSIQNER